MQDAGTWRTPSPDTSVFAKLFEDAPPLSLSCVWGHLERGALLLQADAGARVDCSNSVGCTPLFYASQVSGEEGTTGLGTGT